MAINLNIPDKRLLNLSSLSDDEYSKLLEEYNFDKMSTLPVDEQKSIKILFKKETERRKSLLTENSDKFDELQKKKESIENTLSKVYSVFGDNISYLPGLSNDVKDLKAELDKCNEKLNKMSKDLDSKQTIIDNSKKASKSRFSITKKRATDGRTVVAAKMSGAKQKICSVGKNLLQKLKDKAKKTYENVLDKTNKSFDAYEEKNNAKQAELEQAMTDLFKDDNKEKNIIEGFSTMRNILEEGTKIEKKYSRIQRNGNIEAYLRKGIIRTLNFPKNLINRIREGQVDSLDNQMNEPTFSM